MSSPAVAAPDVYVTKEQLLGDFRHPPKAGGLRERSHCTDAVILRERVEVWLRTFSPQPSCHKDGGRVVDSRLPCCRAGGSQLVRAFGSFFVARRMLLAAY